MRFLHPEFLWLLLLIPLLGYFFGRKGLGGSENYYEMLQTEIVNWLNVQSIPPMLPPYHAGSSQSKLISMLETGHNEK